MKNDEMEVVVFYNTAVRRVFTRYYAYLYICIFIFTTSVLYHSVMADVVGSRRFIEDVAVDLFVWGGCLCFGFWAARFGFVQASWVTLGRIRELARMGMRERALSLLSARIRLMHPVVLHSNEMEQCMADLKLLQVEAPFVEWPTKRLRRIRVAAVCALIVMFVLSLLKIMLIFI
jgi:hypothetical protein